MRKAGIPCPTVALLKKHILVMSFIGKDQKPAPKLKDAVLSSRQLQQAYEQCVEVRCTICKKKKQKEKQNKISKVIFRAKMRVETLTLFSTKKSQNTYPVQDNTLYFITLFRRKDKTKIVLAIALLSKFTSLSLVLYYWSTSKISSRKSQQLCRQYLDYYYPV